MGPKYKSASKRQIPFEIPFLKCPPRLLTEILIELLHYFIKHEAVLKALSSVNE